MLKRGNTNYRCGNGGREMLSKGTSSVGLSKTLLKESTTVWKNSIISLSGALVYDQS